MRPFIKNMVCPRCILAVQQAAEFCEIKIRRISLGELDTEQEHINTGQLEKLDQVLTNFQSMSTIKL